MADLCAWASMRLDIKEPITIIEESDRIDPQMFAELFEDTHHIQYAVVNSTSMGFPCNRRRFWAVMFHKDPSPYMTMTHNTTTPWQQPECAVCSRCTLRT
eukprot:11515019-Alexandrium_andersonii.AAC.1